MSEMVARVAKAMFNATPFKSEGSYEEQTPTYRRLCEVMARAAIVAMREPTAAMLDAPEMRHWALRTEEPMRPEYIAEAWRSMIDAALANTSQQ